MVEAIAVVIVPAVSTAGARLELPSQSLLPHRAARCLRATILLALTRCTSMHVQDMEGCCKRGREAMGNEEQICKTITISVVVSGY